MTLPGSSAFVTKRSFVVNQNFDFAVFVSLAGFDPESRPRSLRSRREGSRSTAGHDGALIRGAISNGIRRRHAQIMTAKRHRRRI